LNVKIGCFRVRGYRFLKGLRAEYFGMAAPPSFALSEAGGIPMTYVVIINELRGIPRPT
jgi:hypothetical protein